jgi:thiosulfate/3-mercaptopyruvate sulfurtransferase
VTLDTAAAPALPVAPRIPPLVDAAWLAAHAPGGGLGPHVVLADVRWYLTDRSGYEAYAEAHLPGAVYVDLDAWLAGAPSPHDGRHPLPDPEVFARGMGSLGIGDDTTVVAYDDAGGVIAARLVWLLRALGREAALLDGGFFAPEVRAWAGGETTEVVERAPEHFTAAPWPTELLATLDDVAPDTREPAAVVVDARPAARFRGEGADVDPRVGHVPGAVSVPCRENVDERGHLLPVEQLRDRFARAGVSAAGIDAGEVVSMCGSGVTACHTLLVLEQVGLGRARLFPGSWSQYSATALPAATGA